MLLYFTKGRVQLKKKISNFPHTVSWPTQLAVWHGGFGRTGSAGVVC